jgi:ATPase family AAA domain-containing protein 2
VEFFLNIMAYIRKAPKDFPDPVNRKLRKLETLKIAPPPPPRLPTKEEIKALKKKDHMILNVLKTLIQPIMDQINKKYKKFRTPVLLPSQIQYLYEEQDPNFVRPDIPQLRPYELSKDKDGTPGILETETGKFFYNLETTTIEERLSNGFYARPKDFLVDIRSLAKDAKQLGDKDRLLKANELLSNVEVDIAVIEADPRVADCENVYQRQLQRTKEKAEKYRKRAQVDAALASLVRSDAPMPGQDVATEDEASGPVTLGEIIPGRRLAPMSTPINTPRSTSNGHLAGSQHFSNPHSHRMSNGSSVPSRHTGDVHMGGTDDSNATQQTHVGSQTMLPPHSQWRNLSRGQSNLSSYPTGTNIQSQTSAFQQIPHDISPGALINDASTTTSGKKTSQSTQLTNGRLDSQSSPGNRTSGGDSQIPDTQNSTQYSTQEGTQGMTSSDEQWPHSQAHGLERGHIVHNYPSQTPSSGSQLSSQPPVPHFDAAPKFSKPTSAGLANILNSPVEQPSSQVSSAKDMVLDETFMDGLLNTFTRKSSGCSIEQLEQINRELMDTLWKMRGEYNRTRVAKQLLDVFNEVIKDIETMQKVLQPSQPETQ